MHHSESHYLMDGSDICFAQKYHIHVRPGEEEERNPASVSQPLTRKSLK